MDYKEKYEKALERAETIFINENYKPDVAASIKESFVKIFPELEETVKERIRKELIKFFRNGCVDALGVDFSTAICWLERQKPIEWTEEDEQMFLDVMHDFDAVEDEWGWGRETARDWLKSIKQKLKGE